MNTVEHRPLTYLEQIAADIYETSGGTDYVNYPPHEASMWLGYAVLCLAKGPLTTSRDVHDAWSAWAVVHHKGEHRSLVPFEELSTEVQAYDDLYRDAIHQVAAMLPSAPTAGGYLRSVIVTLTSDMLDNPDEHGIYPTTEFYEQLERHVRRWGQALLERSQLEVKLPDLSGPDAAVYYGNGEPTIDHSGMLYEPDYQRSDE